MTTRAASSLDAVLAAVYAQLGGLEYIEEIGIPAIRATTAALTEDLIERMRAAGFRPNIAADPQQRSAIVMIPMPDPGGSVRHLAGGGIIADSRPGHVRFSPFFYNLQDDNVRATERLAAQPAH
jgi:selenocysteine lyase/cysteine desulfurase